MLILKRYIVNEDGVIENEIEFGDRLIKAKSLDILNRTITIQKGEQFVKLYTRSIKDLVLCNLNAPEFIIINICISHLQYLSGLVCFENGKQINRNDFIVLSGLSERTLDRALSTLVVKKILGKVKVGHDIKYYVNPYIFMKGDKVNKTLHSMFKSSKWSVKEGE